MEVLNDILGYKNRKIYQNTDYFSFSLDSVMLANFVDIRIRDKKILDIGCGNGVIPLILSMRTDKKIIGVELQSKLCELAIKSVKYNKLEDNIEIVNENIKDYMKNVTKEFDLIVCNPPYFKVNEEKNFFNTSKEKLIARHEVELNLEELLGCVKKLLKNDGNFAMVHRADRFLEIIEMYRKNNIEPKRVQFVYENRNKESSLILIQGQLNGKVGLKIDKPFILKEEDGQYSEQYKKLLVEVRK